MDSIDIVEMVKEMIDEAVKREEARKLAMCAEQSFYQSEEFRKSKNEDKAKDE